MKQPKEEELTHINDAVKLAIKAHRLAWLYTIQEYKRWEPRKDEVDKLDSFHRTAVARERAVVRADWLREETGQVLLKATARLTPFGLGEFKVNFFEECKNRLWRKAYLAYKVAYAKAVEEARDQDERPRMPRL